MQTNEGKFLVIIDQPLLTLPHCQMEQELERVREAHQLLEESNRRRERLELAVRSKLENEVARLRVRGI